MFDNNNNNDNPLTMLEREQLMSLQSFGANHQQVKEEEEQSREQYQAGQDCTDLYIWGKNDMG